MAKVKNKANKYDSLVTRIDNTVAELLKMRDELDSYYSRAIQELANEYDITIYSVVGFWKLLTPDFGTVSEYGQTNQKAWNKYCEVFNKLKKLDSMVEEFGISMPGKGETYNPNGKTAS